MGLSLFPLLDSAARSSRAGKGKNRRAGLIPGSSMETVLATEVIEMSANGMGEVLEHLRKAALLHDHRTLTDEQLLERFFTQRDESAFEALVGRHGPMVFGVCRRIAGNLHDAQDAFQATFLVLVRKASSLKSRELLGNWLYGVAFRTACKARTVATRRRTREIQVPHLPEASARHEVAEYEQQALIDQAVSSLPEKYRVPVVLCELQGRSRREVALQMGIPEGTLSSRLATARKLLAQRLSRHGVVLSAGTLMSAQTASACVPPALVKCTLESALLGSINSAATGAIPLSVAALADGVMQSMSMMKVKLATAVLLAVTVIGLSAGPAAYRSLAGDKPSTTQELSKADHPGRAKLTLIVYQVGDLLRIAKAGKPMGVAIGDVDKDGWPDILLYSDDPLKPADGKRIVSGRLLENASRPKQPEQLVKLITTTIAPKSWAARGGEGTIDYYPVHPALVVYQAPRVHKRIRELLEALRKLSKPPEPASPKQKSAELLRKVHALCKEGKYAEAGALARKAYELDPSNPEVRAAVQLTSIYSKALPPARTTEQKLDLILERLEKLEKRLDALEKKR
jgi:RNA polymerase sigma factor (sigma-70 family)